MLSVNLCLELEPKHLHLYVCKNIEKEGTFLLCVDQDLCISVNLHQQYLSNGVALRPKITYKIKSM